MTYAPTFDRVIFGSLVPALLLPIGVAFSALSARQLHPGTAGDDYGITGIIITAFVFVLMGSMVLNTWLLLRHPQSFTSRALPREISTVVLVLEALLLVWIALLLAGIVEYWSLAIAVVEMVLSIVIFVLALRRRARREPVDAVESIELPTRARVLAIGYVVVAGAALVAAAVLSASGWDVASTGAYGGPVALVLLVAGLPWSHTIYFLTLITPLVLSVWSGADATLGIVAPIVLALAVLVNIKLAILLLVSPKWRARITNWFFLLTRPPAE